MSVCLCVSGGDEREQQILLSCGNASMFLFSLWFRVGHLFSTTPASLSAVAFKLATKTIY